MGNNGNRLLDKFKIKGLDCANCADECKEEVIEKVKKVIKKEEPDVTIEEI